MRKKISVFVLFVFMMNFLVFAIEEPLAIVDNELLISGHITPETDNKGECIPWIIKDEYCSGNIRHYNQCIKTVNGGIWQFKSENCNNYGDNVNCYLGKCIKQENSIMVFALFLIVVLIGYIFLRRRRK